MPGTGGPVNATYPRPTDGYNDDMGTHPDVLIVGGGIIGLTCAHALAEAGLTVELVDRGDLGRQASWAGAGILPPGDPDHAANPLDRLRAVSVRAFPTFSAGLREATGIDNGYRPCGGIEFVPPEDADLPGLWRAERIAFDTPSDAELHTDEPQLKPPLRPAYRFPEMAQVRNPWHLRALIAACDRLGVRLRPHTPFHWTDGTSGGAGHVVIAAGAWADEVLAPLGWRPGVRPVRGQMVLFRPDRPVLSRVVIDGRRYLVPRGDGRVLAGSTEEPDAGFELANTDDGVRSLKEFAVGLVPALADAPVEATWAGLRPGSPDGLPFLGPVPGHDRVIVACGHFRAGIQLSLGTAAVVRSFVTDISSPVLIDAFRLGREPNRTIRPAFRS